MGSTNEKTKGQKSPATVLLMRTYIPLLRDISGYFYI
jgi:hypothetical protein